MLTIGISSCFMYPDINRIVFGPKTLGYIEKDMASYITRKGVLPVLLPYVADNLLEDILKEMDGFIFQGGTDLSPHSYREKPILEGKWLGDPFRDNYEFRLLDFAIRQQKPVLAICRGLQLMNVYFGGTLYQDLTTQRKDAILHRDASLYDQLEHGISLTKGKFLDRIYSDDSSKRVNSVHHQAIKNLGKDLEILATCPADGIIEAIGYTNEPEGKVMGVQWHPEFTSKQPGQVLDPDKLMNIFLEYVKKHKNENHQSCG